MMKKLMLILSLWMGLGLFLHGQDELSGRGVVLEKLIVRDVKPLKDQGFCCGEGRMTMNFQPNLLCSISTGRNKNKNLKN